MMRILYHLKDPDVHAITKAIVDTATSIFAGGPRKNPQYFADPELVRNDAILQLFELGDYTYVDKFFQYINVWRSIRGNYFHDRFNKIVDK